MRTKAKDVGEYAAELAESYVNGNIAYVRSVVRKQSAPVAAVMAMWVMDYLPEWKRADFLRAMSDDLGAVRS